MLPVPGQGSSAGTYFQPTTKCCTFLPELHNFLVGNALDDADGLPAGTASLERRIDAGVAVTPLGLGRSRSYMLVYDDGGNLVFGRARGLRCPHYIEDQGGLCGVWKHRDSSCATWFCKHTRGASGQALWQAIQRVLRIAEGDLAWWCVRELGLDATSVRHLLELQARTKKPRTNASEIDGNAEDIEREKLWGPWRGREREFFRKCGEKVRVLAWSDVVEICGPSLGLAVDVMHSLVKGTKVPGLPERLALKQFMVTALRDEQATITTYSPYDPLLVPAALLELLDAFDGRATNEVLDGLARDHNVELEPAFVQRLIDFGILEPVEDRPR